MQVYANAVDVALNEKHDYGLSPNPQSFGYRANMASATAAFNALNSPELDFERAAEAVHNAWASIVFEDNARKATMNLDDQLKQNKRLQLAGIPCLRKRRTRIERSWSSYEMR